MSDDRGEPPRILVDADACPVKDEILRVAERHRIPIYFVSNAFMRLPKDPLVHAIVVSDGFDAADDWIAERAGQGDIVVTNDIPLAARALDAGALVLGAGGREFTDASIGTALASRAIHQHLRDMGEMTAGGKVFSKRDRSDFLQSMERLCRRAKAMV